MRVLYVSDSLGTPIHPRGIFNFSIALVEILKSAGASVDLVVECSPDFSLEDRFGALKESAPDAVNSVRLSETHRYFNQGQFGFRWGYRTPRIRFLAARGRAFIKFWLSLRERMNYRPNIVVRNDPAQLDFTPQKSEHLNLFDNLVLKRGFYSSSMSRANLGLPPPLLDVSGYDLVVVDTPHFVRLEGLGAARLMTVLHDLIPLRDPTMDGNWRNLFMRKLDATLALGGAMVFVSRHTQRAFHAAFPRHQAAREFVLSPAIRSHLLDEADRLLQAPPQGPPIPEAREPSLAEEAPGSRGEGGRKARGKNKRASRGQPPRGFDASLPLFVTATSDEPRKNIASVVRAFYQHLRGRANIVILGEINSERYDPGPDANIYFPGYVTDAEKIAFFRHARGVVFASLSEGFGIPIVEGAVMGLPALCSDIEVFREVAGDDAFYFEPRDPGSIARAVEDVLSDPNAAAARAAALRQSVVARFSQDAVGAQVRVALGELGLRL